MRRPFSPRAPLLATPTFCTAFGAKCAQCVQHCGLPEPHQLHPEGFPAWRQIVGFLPARKAWGGKRCTGAFALFGCHCAFRAAKQPQTVGVDNVLSASAKRGQVGGGLRGSFGLRNFEMLPLRVFIFYKISFTLLYKAKPNLLQSAFIRKVQ